MKVFITGGTGFIGKFVVKKLNDGKNQLLILSRKSNRAKGKVSYLKGDLDNLKRIENDLKKFKPDATIHLAWEGIPNYGAKTSAQNLKVSLNLMKFLTEINCRTILATGTLWEYGNKRGKLSENMRPYPFNPFTVAKVKLYQQTKEMAETKSINFIWARLFFVYGPGQKNTSLIPYLISCAKTNTVPELRNPNAQNDFIYVEDVAEAIKEILYKCKRSEIFNIGSGRPVAIQRVIKEIFDHYKVQLQYQETTPRKMDKFATAFADVSKIGKEIGWKPKVTIDEGIRKIIEYFSIKP